MHAPLAGAEEKDTEEFNREAQLAHELGIVSEFMPEVPFVKLPGIMHRRLERR